jgi:PIN domain nuclease of toxin-antitoxin system
MILMDTHIFLWFHLGNPALSQSEVQRLLEAQKQSNLFLSSISIWEIAMLEKLKKIALHQPIEAWITQATKRITVVPINPEIALESVKLPYCEHKDPADRFIIATGRIMGLSLATHDQKIIDYAKLGHVNLV